MRLWLLGHLEAGRRLAVEAPELLGCLQPVHGGGDRDAGRERVQAGEVRDRQGGAGLHVHPAVAVGHHAPEAAERRPPVGGGPGQAPDEVRSGIGSRGQRR